MIGEAGGEEVDLKERERSQTKSILGVEVSVVSDSGLGRDFRARGERERERDVNARKRSQREAIQSTPSQPQQNMLQGLHRCFFYYINKKLMFLCKSFLFSYRMFPNWLNQNVWMSSLLTSLNFKPS